MKILKILKKYTLEIIFVLIFVCIQAYCDLELPGYTSDIVNIGIQQGGLTYAVPEKIRKSELDKILMFASSEDKKIILDNYKTEEDIYLLKNNEEENLQKLDKLLSTPIVIAYMLEKNPEIINNSQNTNMNSEAL